MDMILELEPPFLVIKPGLTEEDFYRLAEEDSDWEYLDGRIIMHSPATYEHESLFCFLLTLLRGFVEERGGGVVLGSRFPMRLDRLWSPEPDLLFIREERRHLITPQRLEGPADLVLEIVSESSAHLLYHEKLPRYREADIDEIWVVDPFRRVVQTEFRSKKAAQAREKRSLSGGRFRSEVIPGFWIDVGWLWGGDLPGPLACLREILGGEAHPTD